MTTQVIPTPEEIVESVKKKREKLDEDFLNPIVMLGLDGTTDSKFVFPNIVTSVLKSGVTKNLTSTEMLVRKSGYFIYPHNNRFYYFKIGKLEPSGNHLFRFTPKYPPLLREGFVVNEKVVYYVTLKDLQRGLIRTCNRLQLKAGALTYGDFQTGNIYPTKIKKAKSKRETGEADESRSEGISDFSIDTSIPDITLENLFGKTKRERPVGPSKTTGLDDSEIASVAFEREIKTLLDNVFEEEGSEWEEWEIEEAPQSGHTDKNSPV